MPLALPPVKSLKAFAGEYVMIVLSIVTALALENGVRSYHQSREACEAARNIDAEIAANIAETRSVIAHNSAQVEKIKRLKKRMLEDIKAGTTDREAIKNMMLDSNREFGLSIVTPSLQHEAWDVAVANQALSNMPPEQLRRYAKQYATMRDTQAVLAGSANSFLSMPHLADTFSNLEMNELTAREMYRVLNQMGSLYESNGGNLKDLEKLLAQEQQRALKLASR